MKPQITENFCIIKYKTFRKVLNSEFIYNFQINALKYLSEILKFVLLNILFVSSPHSVGGTQVGNGLI